MRHIGCYWPDRTFTLAAQIGNFVICGTDLLADADRLAALRMSGLRLVLQLGVPTQDHLLNTHDLQTRELHDMRAGLVEAGVLEQLIAVMPSEEWYRRLAGGAFEAWPGVIALQAAGLSDSAIAGLFASALGKLALLIRSVFPGVYVGHVEPWWEDRIEAGPSYAPVPPAYDFLGVDAYVPGAITRDHFEDVVARAYAGARRYGKPLLMVTQTFADGSWPWLEMPTPAQLEWWADLAARDRRIVGIAHFCLRHPGQDDPRHPRGYGLTDYPDRLDAVRAFYQEAQRAA